MEIPEPQKALKEWIEVVHALLTTVAIVVGSIWAYFKFRITRVKDWNLNLHVEYETKRYSGEIVLLIVTVSANNIGRVPVRLIDGEKRGVFTIYLYKIEPRKVNKEIDYRKKERVRKIDIVRGLSGEYYIKPGATYCETEAIPVLPGLYAISVHFRELDGVTVGAFRYAIVDSISPSVDASVIPSIPPAHGGNPKILLPPKDETVIS